MGRRTAGTLGVLGAILVAAPGAQANFHLMKISEVAIAPAGLESSFIELQMYAAGQNFVGGHLVRFYEANGTPADSLTLTDVANGANQRTILIGDTAVPGRDIAFNTLFENVSTLGPGGAACFDSIDCVAWGNFSNTALTPLPSPPGTPAPPIPDDSSLNRSIAPNCATLLEATDDTNDSLADFAIGTPSPRSNAVVPTETACSGGGGPSGATDTNPPETKIDKGPKKRSAKTKAKFKFASNESGSTFECKLDRSAFEVCAAKAKYRKLEPGKHRFEVFATDSAGNPDRTPAKYRFKIVEK